jgi:polyisoprenoid-binding protein YceI
MKLLSTSRIALERAPRIVKVAALCLLAFSLRPSVSRAHVPADAPVFEIMRESSTVKFAVQASVAIAGTFDKWEATITTSSPDPSSGVLDVKIQADSVDTGSGMKDSKLKSKDFFDAKDDPYITFHSTKVTQTGPNTLEFDGDFTKPEKLTFTVTGKGTGEGSITGTMAFDRKEFGMNSGIPFIKIADRVEGKCRSQRQASGRASRGVSINSRPSQPFRHLCLTPLPSLIASPPV